MTQAITTRYIGPANVRGTRVKASCNAGSLTMDWDHDLNHEGNHKAAAKALVAKLGWGGTWAAGSLKSSGHWAWVDYSVAITFAGGEA